MQTVVVQGSQVDGNYIDAANVETNFLSAQQNNFIRLGLVPEGFYSFCIYAYVRDINGHFVQVSDPRAAGTCFNLT